VDIFEQLRRDEGVRSSPYVDTVGKITIGVGYNLTDRGMSDEWIESQLQADVSDVTNQLRSLTFWINIDEVRQGVFINMAFNLGFDGLMKFTRMLGAIQQKDWNSAATAMLDSKWAEQVGGRANRLAEQMRTGEWV